MKKHLILIIFTAFAFWSTSCRENARPIDKTAIFSISGLVEGSNHNFSEIVISIGSKEVNSNKAGKYSLTHLNSGSYKLIPKLSGYRFEPKSIDVTIDKESITGINFSVIPNTGEIVTSQKEGSSNQF